MNNGMNPMEMMRIASMIQKFKSNHPKLFPFFREASTKIADGSVIEITVTDPQGESLTSNIRVKADDLELIAALRDMGMNMPM